MSKKSVVTNEDQAEISTFAYLHMETAEKKVELGKANTNLQNIKDAEDELDVQALTADDDEAQEPIPFKIGNIFILCDQESDEVRALIEKEKEVLSDKIDELTAVIHKHEAAMSKLKTVLYSKFGDNINLENTDE